MKYNCKLGGLDEEGNKFTSSFIVTDDSEAGAKEQAEDIAVKSNMSVLTVEEYGETL